MKKELRDLLLSVFIAAGRRKPVVPPKAAELPGSVLIPLAAWKLPTTLIL